MAESRKAVAVVKATNSSKSTWMDLLNTYKQLPHQCFQLFR